MHIERVGTIVVVIYEETIVTKIIYFGTMHTDRQCTLLDRQRIMQYIQRAKIDIGLSNVKCIAIVGIYRINERHIIWIVIAIRRLIEVALAESGIDYIGNGSEQMFDM